MGLSDPLVILRYRRKVDVTKSSCRVAKAYLEISLKKTRSERWSGLEQLNIPGVKGNSIIQSTTCLDFCMWTLIYLKNVASLWFIFQKLAKEIKGFYCFGAIKCVVVKGQVIFACVISQLIRAACMVH